MEYFIYHIIKNKKVGCTNNIERRMKEQHVEMKDVDILGIYFNEKEASKAEELWRNSFGYSADDPKDYSGTIKQNNKSKMLKRPKREKIHLNSRNVGINENLGSKEELLAYLSNDTEMVLGTSGGTFKFTEKSYKALTDKALNSKFEDFFWSHIILETIYNDIESKETVADGPCCHRNRIPEFDQIREWASEKGIYAKGDPKTQLVKLIEEQGEFAKAILKNDQPEIIDALGDMLVVLINLSELSGYKLEDCLSSAYEVISKRTGKMIDGTFVKDTL